MRAFGINFTGSVCDVGCSTGEFLEYTKWSGKKYGMGGNQKAMQAAQKQGIINKNILNSTSYFDVVIMRGVIQHLDQPYSISNKPKIHLKRVAIWYSYKPQILAVFIIVFFKICQPWKRRTHIFFLTTSKSLHKNLKDQVLVSLELKSLTGNHLMHRR